MGPGPAWDIRVQPLGCSTRDCWSGPGRDRSQRPGAVGCIPQRGIIEAFPQGIGVLLIALRKVRVSTPSSPQIQEPVHRLLEYELDVPMQKILITTQDLNRRIMELGRELSDHYRGRLPLLVSVLKGGVVFLTDLMRAISIPHHIDFLQLSSYAGGTESSGTVRLLSDLGTSITNRDVVLVEDIVDTGLTLSYLMKQLEIRSPRSLRVCTLLSKTEARRVQVPIDYLGFEIPNEFVVGYGLDYQEKYRNLPYIGVLDL